MTTKQKRLTAMNPILWGSSGNFNIHLHLGRIYENIPPSGLTISMGETSCNTVYNHRSSRSIRRNLFISCDRFPESYKTDCLYSILHSYFNGLCDHFPYFKRVSKRYWI